MSQAPTTPTQSGSNGSGSNGSGSNVGSLAPRISRSGADSQGRRHLLTQGIQQTTLGPVLVKQNRVTGRMVYEVKNDILNAPVKKKDDKPNYQAKGQEAVKSLAEELARVPLADITDDSSVVMRAVVDPNDPFAYVDQENNLQVWQFYPNQLHAALYASLTEDNSQQESKEDE